MYQDSAGTTGSAQAQSDSDWAGPAAAAAPGNYGGPGGLEGPGAEGYSHRPAGRRASIRALAVTAAVAMAAGAGTTWALVGGAGSGAVLTTAQVVTKTDPGLVDVISTLGDQGGTAYGTGIVLTSSGEVLTNNHVIDGATSVKVRDVGNGRTYTATIVGYSESHDIAVLQLSGASGLSTATLGNSSAVGVGDKVVGIGNAGGQDGTPSVATGRVTGLNQSITANDESSGVAEQLKGLIETNANIQPGDSGGPLTNTHGQVIGVDTAGSTGSTGQLGSTPATQAFSIPINEALSVASQIDAGTSSSAVHIGGTAFLGVQVSSSSTMQPGSGAGAGAQIAGVVQGTAAADAGLAAGDTITSLAGHAIASPSQIRTVLTQYHPGDKISISWTDQAGDSQTATITLGSGPAA